MNVLSNAPPLPVPMSAGTGAAPSVRAGGSDGGFLLGDLPSLPGDVPDRNGGRLPCEGCTTGGLAKALWSVGAETNPRIATIRTKIPRAETVRPRGLDAVTHEIS